jgi:hypothetical protein
VAREVTDREGDGGTRPRGVDQSVTVRAPKHSGPPLHQAGRLLRPIAGASVASW